MWVVPTYQTIYAAPPYQPALTQMLVRLHGSMLVKGTRNFIRSPFHVKQGNLKFVRSSPTPRTSPKARWQNLRVKAKTPACQLAMVVPATECAIATTQAWQRLNTLCGTWGHSRSLPVPCHSGAPRKISRTSWPPSLRYMLGLEMLRQIRTQLKINQYRGNFIPMVCV